MRPRNLALLLVLLLVFGWQAWQHQARVAEGARSRGPTAAAPIVVAAPPPAAPPAVSMEAPHPSDAAADAGVHGDARLPREVRDVLARIRAGGPYPYERDGVVFGNFERRLPQRPRGWYHEYTVPTPGQRGRGARRIIAGGRPPTEFWYTGDHYETVSRLDARGDDASDSAGAAR
jgi:guanyl-specific ribonuclease Sa